MSAHPLKIHHHPAKRPSQRPPLLFVHGGYTNARCWEHNFIPYFQQKGYDCHALDLSGHGASGGHERLHDFGIKDYARDVAHAVAELPARPVLIGHSMGTLVLRSYLSGAPDAAAGVALLSPVPPTGTGGSASRLALQQPDFFAELEHGASIADGKPFLAGLKRHRLAREASALAALAQGPALSAAPSPAASEWRSMVAWASPLRAAWPCSVLLLD